MSAQQKTPVAGGDAGHIKTLQDNSTSSQRGRLLAQLKSGPVTTIDARKALDIMHPAARVQELRERGYSIITLWQVVETRPGRKHRFANYVLQLRRLEV